MCKIQQIKKSISQASLTQNINKIGRLVEPVKM